MHSDHSRAWAPLHPRSATMTLSYLRTESLQAGFRRGERVDTQLFSQTLRVRSRSLVQRCPRRIGDAVDSIEETGDSRRVYQRRGAHRPDHRGPGARESVVIFDQNRLAELN